MVDLSRLKDLENLLDLLYEKLGDYERELSINNSVHEKFELEQRIKHEIMPSIRRYETEYWEEKFEIRAAALGKSVIEIESELEEMANDLDIQRELAAIELEFTATSMDGLSG